MGLFYKLVYNNMGLKKAFFLIQYNTNKKILNPGEKTAQ